MTIYLAGPWVCKPAVREARAKFEAAGIKVRADWIDFHGDIADDDPDREAKLQHEAYHDLEQIRGAEAFVVLSIEKSSGKESEFMYAYLHRKPCIVVQNVSNNIFYHLAAVTRVNNVEEAISALHHQGQTRNREDRSINAG